MRLNERLGRAVYAGSLAIPAAAAHCPVLYLNTR